MASPDPVVLQGPQVPAEFARIVELPEDQVGRYAQLYERFMASTRPQRDSLTAVRRDLRSTFEQGDQDAARLQLGQLRPLAEELKRGQATFDETCSRCSRRTAQPGERARSSRPCSAAPRANRSFQSW